MYIIPHLKPMTYMDICWTSLYIVDLNNVYCASSFVCLLVELHTNACITCQVLKFITMGSGPSSESIKKYMEIFKLMA